MLRPLRFVRSATVAALLAATVVALSSCSVPPGCGSITAAPPATYKHVIWILMENQNYSSVIGNSSAPYINSVVSACGLATNYTAVSHPSLPNYIALTSGSTQGITADGPPATYPQAEASIFSQVTGAGLTAGSFQEDMPSNCAQADSGLYAAKHNPEAFYTGISAACANDNVPLGTATSGAFQSELSSNTLPAFSFVTPNLCDDMHSCPVSTGDTWLSVWLPLINQSPGFQAGNTAVFVVWDEDGCTLESGTTCLTGGDGNQVPAIVVSPYTKAGTQSATAFTHYSLLRTTEDLLGIKSYLGNAASATSMRSAFGL